MNKIKLVAEGIDVRKILWQLQQHPELWDQHEQRTQDAESPHHGLSDIWVRFAPAGSGATEAHDSVWYDAADVLDIKKDIFNLFSFVNGTRLGGVLITKIPAGKECKPHTDTAWHASFYEKFAIQIQSAPGQKFCFEGEELETKPGDVFWFDNSYLHWVTNPTEYDRITLIVCIRRD